MPSPLSSVNIANLSTRLGKIFGYGASISTQMGPMYGANLTSLLTQFDGTDYRDAVAGFINGANPVRGFPASIGATLYSGVASAANNLILNTIRVEGSTYDGTLITAYRGLRDAMTLQSKSFKKATSASATLTMSTNLGTGTALVRAQRPASSDYLQEMFDELITARCTAAGNVNNFGAATFLLSGPVSYQYSNTLWPNGSGVGMTMTATPAAINSPTGAVGRSIIANGAFENWAGDTPGTWTIVTGTAGTHVVKSSSPARGAYALSMVGNGSTLTHLRQQLAYSNSTPVSIQPDTDYALICYAKKTASGTAGVVKIGLRDSSNTVITGSSEITLNLSSVTTSYAISSATFSIAKSAIPTTVYLDIYSTTAIGSGNSLIIDELVLVPMTSLYPGGPTVVIYPGTIDYAVDDGFEIDVVNNYTTSAKFMSNFARYIGMERQGIYLPVSSSPTESDSLVTI